ncbi:MAG TPA: HlyD family secretion protein [Acidobacteriaceae bacterium]
MADQSEQQHNGADQGGQTAQISGTVQIKPQGGEGQKAQGGQNGNGGDSKSKDEAPEKKGKRRFIVIAVLLVLAIVGGIFYWHSTFTEDTDDAQVDGDLYQVSARVAGQVVNVYVKDNQTVEAGALIAEVDPADFKVALEQAKANLANAQAEYEQAKTNVPITSVNVRTTVSTSGSDVANSQASVSQAEADTAAAESRIEQAKANAIKAQLDVDRYTPLVQKDVISKQQFDAAVAQARATTAAVTEAERALTAQKDKINQAKARLAQAQSQEQQSRQTAPDQVRVQQARAQAALASVQQAQSRVDQAELNLSYTKIKAPVGGIVSKKNVDVGENLSVGQDLLTIVPLDNLWVTANFKETQLKQMKSQQEVDLKVDALGGRKFHGHLTEIGGATGSRLSLFPPENATGNYVKVVQRIPVRIDFDNLADENKDHALRPGMSVTPDVRVKQ